MGHGINWDHLSHQSNDVSVQKIKHMVISGTQICRKGELHSSQVVGLFSYLSSAAQFSLCLADMIHAFQPIASMQGQFYRCLAQRRNKLYVVEHDFLPQYWSSKDLAHAQQVFYH